MIQVAHQPHFADAQLSTGVRLHYAQQGPPGGEPLVFLSQRGHGDSERPAGGYAIDDFAADVAAFLDAVGAARVTLIGHSLGSLVARRVAETYPARVARLVLIGALRAPVNAAARELRDFVWGLEDPVPPEFIREFQASTVHAPVPAPFFERVVVESSKLPVHVWQAVADGFSAFDDSADLGRIAAPTLLLWGKRDAYFPRAEQEFLAGAIPGARLTIYAETGHSPHWERPQRVADDLEAFVSTT
jgi:pimeloyl-ACP methyl ester carboxylesterase